MAHNYEITMQSYKNHLKLHPNITNYILYLLDIGDHYMIEGKTPYKIYAISYQLLQHDTFLYGSCPANTEQHPKPLPVHIGLC